MKTLLFALAVLLSSLAIAQPNQRQDPPSVWVGGNDPSSCKPGDLYVSTVVKVCNAAGTGVTQLMTFATPPTGDIACVAGSCTVSTGLGWAKYSVAVKATCASTNACWTVNGVEGADLAAGLTQDVTLFQLPANGCVDIGRLKSSVAFTGAATTTASIGVAGTNTFFLAAQNIKSAVSATNLFAFTAGKCSSSTAAINVVAGIVTTTDNITTLAALSAFDVWVKTSVLP